MDTVLGLFGLFFYIALIVGLAASVTWLVVKLSPSQSAKQAQAKAKSSA